MWHSLGSSVLINRFELYKPLLPAHVLSLNELIAVLCMFKFAEAQGSQQEHLPKSSLGGQFALLHRHSKPVQARSDHLSWFQDMFQNKIE